MLAPLTRGGNRPYRALVTALGCEATMGEMAYAREIAKRRRRELRLLDPHASERLFGAQIATNSIAEGAAAAEAAARAGATWVDLNCGCPTRDVLRRGLGAALLRKPAKLARLVAGVTERSPLPLTVKIRLAPPEAKKPSRDAADAVVAEREAAAEAVGGGAADAADSDDAADDADGEMQERAVALARAVADAGAAAVSVHGRTARQRYKNPADYDAIERIAAALARDTGAAVLGNGDVLTWREAEARAARAPHARALLVGRGALVKPWIFDELKARETWLPTAAERVSVYRRMTLGFRDQFGGDAHGRRHAWYFLPWHFSFLCRWRPISDADEAALAARATAGVYFGTPLAPPLLQSGREIDDRLATVTEGPRAALPPLERLLRCEAEAAHERVADALWDAASDADAVARLELIAADARQLAEWERGTPADAGARAARSPLVVAGA